MLLLEPSHPAIAQLVKDWASGIEHKIYDFDSVVYHFVSEADDATLRVQVKMDCFPELRKFGADDYLRKVYGDMIVPSEAGYHFSLLLKKDAVAKSVDEVAKAVSLLKRNMLAAPLAGPVEALLSGAPVTKDMVVIKFRDSDCMYVQRGADRVVVTFQLYFAEPDDRTLSHVFLQEFADANKQLRTAPPCSYKETNRPDTLTGVPGVREGPNTSFLVFVMEKRHVEGEKKERLFSLLTSFRSYLAYHMKCSKAFMHSRMRARTEALLQVLRRAQPEKVAAKPQSAAAAAASVPLRR